MSSSTGTSPNPGQYSAASTPEPGPLAEVLSAAGKVILVQTGRSSSASTRSAP